jgi:hypothetical protein
MRSTRLAGRRPVPTDRVAIAASPVSNADYIASANAAFERAYAVSGSQFWFRVAHRLIRIEIAGDVLRDRLVPALRARAAEPAGSPSLSIRAWDAAATGIPLPPRPWDLEDDRVRGNLRARPDGDSRVHFQPGSDTFSAFEPRERLGLFWTRNADRLPAWEDASPFRTVMHWWAASEGLQLVHGAAVGNEDGAVLLAGRGGSGKSTTAVACLAASMRFAGDDYVIVGDSGAPTVFSLYGTAKLEPVHAARFPELARFPRWPRRADLDKEVLDLAGENPDLLPESQRLRAILAVHVAPEASTAIRPLSPARVLAALAPSTLLQLPQTDSSALGLLTRITRGLPGGELRIGRDLTGAPAAIAAFLSGLPH